MRSVEDSLSLSIASLKKAGLLDGGKRSGTSRWTWEDGSETSVGLEVDPGAGFVRFSYTLNRAEDLDYQAGLVSSRPNFGGRRYFFLCPQCRARVTALYLPTGAERFACRKCQRLLYRSSLESGTRYGRLKKQIRGKTPNQARDILYPRAMAGDLAAFRVLMDEDL